MHPRMDAAVPAGAQNAPTATWKTANTAVSHSAHTQHSFVRREGTKDDHASHTEFLTLPSALALLDEGRQLARILGKIVVTSKRRAGLLP